VRALEEGRLVTIKGGILELELGSRSRLVLEAPAEFAIESSTVVQLVSGRCYAEMEKGTSGLRIKTPSGEVLDLETRFGVEVTRSEGTSVHVFVKARWNLLCQRTGRCFAKAKARGGRKAAN
jgi:hypothetical protein